MGFFDFLKKKEPETVLFSDLRSWLDKQVEDKNLNKKLEAANKAVKQKISQAYKHLEELETAGLKNENIPEKAKQVMQGHKNAYISKLKRFLDEITLPENFSQAGHAAARFSEALDELSRNTQKNYMVLKEFVEEELSKVARGVKEIEEELSGLQKSIEEQGIEAIRDARAKLKQYSSEISKKAELEEQKEKQKQKLQNLKEKKDKFRKRINELKQSRDYSSYKNYLEKKEKYEEQLKNIEQELKNLFVELSRPLKKYKRKSLDDKLIEKYLLDPAGALEEDDGLRLRDVLNKMRQALDNLELKENQVQKTLDLLEKLDKDYLMNKKLELGRLKGLNQEAAKQINRSVVALNISENETLSRNVKEKISEAQKALDQIEQEISEINLDYLKQKAKEKAKQIKNIIIKDE